MFSAAGAPFDAATLTQIRSMPAVASAAPSLAVEARLGAVPMVLRGVEVASYQAFVEAETDLARLGDETALLAPALLSIREGWRVGQTLTAQTDAGRTATLILNGQLPGASGPPAAQAEALITLAQAQILAGTPGQVGLVQVRLHEGADLVVARNILADQLGADLLVVQNSLDAGPSINILGMRLLLGMVGLIVLLVAAFVIANTFGMGITARTSELGALRTLGTTRWQLLGIVLVEASLLGLLGALLGIPLGLTLVWGAFAALRMGNPPEAAWWTLALAPLLGLLLALLAALAPALRAARVAPIMALRPAAASPRHAKPALWRPLAALVVLLVSVGAISVVVRPDFIAALLLLLPALVAWTGPVAPRPD
ncbi:MAG: FtsX-like permease family protein [Oscillochloridaceae bacterium umkhey_bin13]